MIVSLRTPGAASGLTLVLFLAACRVPYDRSVVRQRGHSLGWPALGEGSAEAAAEEPTSLAEDADLEGFLHFGLRHHAGLQAAFARWQAALERSAQVLRLPDPKFSYAQFLEPIETRTGPQRTRISLEQRFPWLGELQDREDAAARDAEALWFDLERQRHVVERDIRVTYHEYAFLGERLRITSANLELLRQFEPVVQRKVQGGAGQENLLRLQVEIGKLEDERASLEQLRPALAALLAARVHDRGAPLYPWPVLAEPAPDERDTARWVERAREASPELRRLHQHVLRDEHLASAATASIWPDVTLGIDYFQTSRARNPGVHGSGDDPVALRIGFDLPLWLDRYTAAEAEAEYTLAATQQQYQQRRVELDAEVQQELYQLGDARRRLGLYRETLLPRARQSLDLLLSSYRTGESALLDLIDGERLLLEFEVSFWRACRDYYQSRARLVALCGGEPQ